VKDYDLDARVKAFKATIRANGEREDAKIINLLSLPLKTLYLTGIIITWDTTQIVLLQNCN
jgi:hypothetical protein